MDKTWQKNLLAFLAMIAGMLAILTYIAPKGRAREDDAPSIQSEVHAINVKVDLLATVVTRLDRRVYALQGKNKKAGPDEE